MCYSLLLRNLGVLQQSLCYWIINMPVSFLSPAQRDNYGRYPDNLSPELIANHFFLDSVVTR
jgi:hypothetical protein